MSVERMTSGGLGGVLIATGVLAACSGTVDRREPMLQAAVGEPGPDSLLGVVRQVGNLPFARTVVQGEGGAVTVVGEYEPELRRLVGATVLVSGERVDGAAPGRAMGVTAYEIRSIDGERPYVGTLTREGGSFRLEDEAGRGMSLQAVRGELAAALGGRVWVLIDDAGGVYRYGILRPPEEAHPVR